MIRINWQSPFTHGQSTVANKKRRDLSRSRVCALRHPGALARIKRVLIDIRNPEGQELYTAEVDVKQRPTKVRPPQGQDGPEVYLEWDRALDDRKCLRRCPVCGCWDLHIEKPVPHLTPFVVVLGMAVIFMAVLDMAPVLIRATAGLMVVIGVIELVVRFALPTTLRCYQCRSQFHKAPVPRGMRPWQPAVAERYKGVVRSSSVITMQAPPSDGDEPATADKPSETDVAR